MIDQDDDFVSHDLTTFRPLAIGLLVIVLTVAALYVAFARGIL